MSCRKKRLTHLGRKVWREGILPTTLPSYMLCCHGESEVPGGKITWSHRFWRIFGCKGQPCNTHPTKFQHGIQQGGVSRLLCWWVWWFHAQRPPKKDFPRVRQLLAGGLFLPPFARKLATPSKRNPSLRGGRSFSQAGKKTPLIARAKTNSSQFFVCCMLKFEHGEYQPGPRISSFFSAVDPTKSGTTAAKRNWSFGLQEVT